MVVRESKVREDETEVFLTRFYLGIQSQASKSRGKRKWNRKRWEAIECEGFPYWPLLYNVPDAAGLLTNLLEKLYLKGRRNNRECVCLLPSWLLVSISQSVTHRQLASQPCQVATLSPFGILLESQIAHPACTTFLSSPEETGEARQPSPPTDWSTPGARAT